jgi:hypothetical protein
MNRRFTVVSMLVFTMLCSAAAFGQDDPIAATAQMKPYLADQPLVIRMQPVRDNNPVPDRFTGWVPYVQGRLYGHTKSGDLLKIEFGKGGNVAHTVRINLNGIDADRGDYYEDFNLSGSDDDDLITGEGLYTVTFKYYDDNTEQDAVIAEKRMNIVKAVDYDAGEGQNIWKNAMLYDDMPAISYIWLSPPRYHNMSGRAYFYNWINRDEDEINDLSFKITVDGTDLSLPGDFAADCGSLVSIEQMEDLYDNTKNVRVDNWYKVYQMRYAPYLYWGERQEGDAEEAVIMGEHPGDWVVKIRSLSETIRELRFKVDENGLVVPHPEQDSSNPDCLKLGPMRFFVNTFYPNPNNFDTRFNSEAIRESSFYGRPWISDMSEMMDALPPSKVGAMLFPHTALPPKKK